MTYKTDRSALCVECRLMIVEAALPSRKIKPSHTHCFDCLRIRAALERQPNELRQIKKIIHPPKVTKLPERLSISYLQRKLKVSYEDAKLIFERHQHDSQNICNLSNSFTSQES